MVKPASAPAHDVGQAVLHSEFVGLRPADVGEQAPQKPPSHWHFEVAVPDAEAVGLLPNLVLLLVLVPVPEVVTALEIPGVKVLIDLVGAGLPASLFGLVEQWDSCRAEPCQRQAARGHSYFAQGAGGGITEQWFSDAPSPWPQCHGLLKLRRRQFPAVDGARPGRSLAHRADA
jgi:hypothetical protein